jgi:DNA replication protein DnaC
VVLDDISRERGTAFNHDRLHYYLRKRSNDCLITIVTTNYAPDEWPSVYGDVLGPFMQRSLVAAEVT